VRSLIAPAFVTVDGVMQAPGGPDEDPTGGFTQGGWAVNHWDDTMYSAMGEMLASPFDLLLGRRTYEIFASYWPTQSDDDPFAKILNGLPKYPPLGDRDDMFRGFMNIGPSIDYLERAAPLVGEEERVDLLLKLGKVVELVGDWQRAEEVEEEALKVAEMLGDEHARACVMVGEVETSQSCDQEQEIPRLRSE